MNGWRGVVVVLLMLLLAAATFFGLSNKLIARAPETHQTVDDNSAHPGWVELTGEPLSGGEIFKKVAPSIVVVLVNNKDKTGSMGTGFIVNDEGNIITNHHVIQGGQQIFIKYSNGKVVPATRVMAVSAKWDLALIEAPQLNGAATPLKLAQGVPPLSSDILVVGTPNGFPHSLAVGSLLAARGRDLERLEISAPIRAGYSGSPVFNCRGQVIGVASQGSVGADGVQGFATSIISLSRFLKEKPMDTQKPHMQELPEHDDSSNIRLLPGGGYRARVTVASQPLYKHHSLESPAIAYLSKGDEVRVVREWVEYDPRVARLRENLIIQLPGGGGKKLSIGDGVRINNPALKGDGLVITVKNGEDPLEILLNDSQIERMVDKKWSQVVTESGKHGWIPREDLKEKKGILGTLLALFR